MCVKFRRLLGLAFLFISTVGVITPAVDIGEVNTHLKRHRHKYALGLGGLAAANIIRLAAQGKLSTSRLKKLLTKENRSATLQLLLGSVLPALLAGAVEWNGYGYTEEPQAPEEQTPEEEKPLAPVTVSPDGLDDPQSAASTRSTSPEIPPVTALLPPAVSGIGPVPMPTSHEEPPIPQQIVPMPSSNEAPAPSSLINPVAVPTPAASAPQKPRARVKPPKQRIGKPAAAPIASVMPPVAAPQKLPSRPTSPAVAPQHSFALPLTAMPPRPLLSTPTANSDPLPSVAVGPAVLAPRPVSPAAAPHDVLVNPVAQPAFRAAPAKTPTLAPNTDTQRAQELLDWMNKYEEDHSDLFGEGGAIDIMMQEPYESYLYYTALREKWNSLYGNKYGFLPNSGESVEELRVLVTTTVAKIMQKAEGTQEARLVAKLKQQVGRGDFLQGVYAINRAYANLQILLQSARTQAEASAGIQDITADLVGELFAAGYADANSTRAEKAFSDSANQQLATLNLPEQAAAVVVAGSASGAPQPEPLAARPHSSAAALATVDLETTEDRRAYAAGVEERDVHSGKVTYTFAGNKVLHCQEPKETTSLDPELVTVWKKLPMSGKNSCIWQGHFADYPGTELLLVYGCDTITATDFMGVKSNGKLVIMRADNTRITPTSFLSHCTGGTRFQATDCVSAYHIADILSRAVTPDQQWQETMGLISETLHPRMLYHIVSNQLNNRSLLPLEMSLPLGSNGEDFVKGFLTSEKIKANTLKAATPISLMPLNPLAPRAPKAPHYLPTARIYQLKSEKERTLYVYPGNNVIHAYDSTQDKVINNTGELVALFAGGTFEGYVTASNVESMLEHSKQGLSDNA